MIITCPNCNKQFKIDNSLIPDEGRDLQCGSCNYLWFYKIEEKNNEVLELKQEILSEDIETKAGNKTEKIEAKNQTEETIKTEINKKKENNSEKQKKTTSFKKREIKRSKFFSYLIVFIISFIALIILLDTLRTPIINVFPGIEIILFSLFETLKDIKLFIIDLF